MRATAQSVINEPSSSDHSTIDASERQKWNQRKILIIAVNPKIQAIFDKSDSDYFELFSEMGSFQSIQQQIALGSNEQEVKKMFFEKHYDKILVHFFEYLFDFELQTLQFTEKHQTILSFAQWIETQVVFDLPDGIKLLNVKKSQNKSSPSQKLSIQKQQSVQKSQKTKSLKRPFNQEIKVGKSQVVPVSSKKIVVQDGEKGLNLVNSNSKYPNKKQENQSQRQIEKFFVNGSLILDHEFSKRQIKKVNGAKKSGPQFQQSQTKTSKKTQNEMRKSQEKKSVEKKENKTNCRKDKSVERPNASFKRKTAAISEMENIPIIVLDTSQQKSKDDLLGNDTPKTNQLAYQKGKDSEKFSQTSSNKINENFKINEQNNFLAEQGNSKANDNLLTKPSFLLADLIMDEIIQRQRSEIHKQPQKDMKKKLHQFQAKLYGLMKYSEKRYYIFPDFAPDLEDTDYNEKTPQRQSSPKKISKLKKPNLN